MFFFWGGSESMDFFFLLLFCLLVACSFSLCVHSLIPLSLFVCTHALLVPASFFRSFQTRITHTCFFRYCITYKRVGSPGKKSTSSSLSPSRGYFSRMLPTRARTSHGYFSSALDSIRFGMDTFYPGGRYICTCTLSSFLFPTHIASSSHTFFLTKGGTITL